MVNNVNSTKINQSILSDHKIVSFIIASEWKQRYLKINNDILNDYKYVIFIQKTIREFCINNPKGHVSPHTLWELLKCVIRGETIKYCAEKKKLTKQQSILENRLEYLQSQLSSCNINEKDNILSMMAKTQSDLNCFVEKIAQGAAIRSGARWMEFGEKSNKYFLSLEKWHCSKKYINSLQNEQGILIHIQKKILNELANCYKNLYFDNEQSDENNCYDFVTELNLSIITDKKCKECDKSMSKECLTALFQLSSNKTPGLDGFSIEFYKTFWKYLDNFFLENIYFSINQKRLCNSQYDGLITPLSKSNKNRLNPCNYRPITSLNYFTKYYPK